MALVTILDHVPLKSHPVHTHVDCTYDVVVRDGKKYLQLDTYGSASRQKPGKKSQSIQFGPEAIQQLKEILRAYDL